MYLGEQLVNPSDARIALAAQLGVEHFVVEMGAALDGPVAGRWDGARIAALQARTARHGISVDVIGLDVPPLLLALVQGDEERQHVLFETAIHNIRTAAEAGVPCLKYSAHMFGVLRSGRTVGRGGAQYQRFDIDEATEDAIAQYTGHGTSQPRLSAIGPVSAAQSWDALTAFLARVIPVAEECGIHLAFHPQDPPLPPDAGLHGVHHVLSSVAGLKQFLTLTPSTYHVMNFCQGTVAEMCANPATEVLDAIRYFGEIGKIYMVHFRNIRGHNLHFEEVYPDNGDVDMYRAIQVYQEVGYRGMICPDHVPVSAEDPDRERQFAFCLGYIKALLQVTGAVT